MSARRSVSLAIVAAGAFGVLAAASLLLAADGAREMRQATALVRAYESATTCATGPDGACQGSQASHSCGRPTPAYYGLAGGMGTQHR